MRVAIYSRVSTGHQVEHQTIEQQIERLTAHVGAHHAEGWTLDPAHLFRDDGYSGAALARPGLDGSVSARAKLADLGRKAGSVYAAVRMASAAAARRW